MSVVIRAELSPRAHDFPDGKPISVVRHRDGSSTYTISSGAKFRVGQPTHLLEYENHFGTYLVEISLTGRTYADRAYFEAWNHKINEARYFLIKRAVRIKHLETGEVIEREALQQLLRDL